MKHGVTNLRVIKLFLLLLFPVLIACSGNSPDSGISNGKSSSPTQKKESKAKQSSTLSKDEIAAVKERGEKEFYKYILSKAEAYKGSRADRLAAIYDIYAVEYPQGVYRSDIAKHKEKGLFLLAKRLKTVRTYNSYLDEYPRGEYIDEVKRLKEMALFNQVKEKRSVEKIDQYVEEYPGGLYLKQVEEIREALFLEKARQWGTIQGFQEYLIQYPKGKYLEYAHQQIEEMNFRLVTKLNTIQAYDLFLIHFPESKYKPEIIKLRKRKWNEKISTELPMFQCSEVNAWDFTKKVDNAFQYNWFIRNFPKSRFIEKAKERLREKTESNKLLK